LTTGAQRSLSALARLARQPHLFVPQIHGSRLPARAVCDDDLLPAHSAIRTPHAELAEMFLLECERGCSRNCTYCVMRRGAGRGMRLVPREVILERVPSDIRRVGLVGAAVSDHPEIAEIVRALAMRSCKVGLSSLRPDRLRPDLVAALKLTGCRTLTTGLDGASERLRAQISRGTQEQHFISAAEQAREHGMRRLKLYLMIGLPGETDADLDECVRLLTTLARTAPVALAIAPFCAKRNTPLDGTPYAGVRVVEARVARLRRGLRGRAEVRSTSARWAWVEHVLAQGGEAEGRAVAEAVHAGGHYAHHKAALAKLGHRP
jgi:radical SAM superfamily enzyme YgiQ (UPF0313 family)